MSAPKTISGRNNSTRCINFSCPLNRVPKALVDHYLKRNPVMLAAWEETGYVLGQVDKPSGGSRK